MESSEIAKQFWESQGKRINTGVIQVIGDAKAEYIFSERDVIKNFLTEIKDDIESIDCGCSDCIGSFISGVNTVIKKYGLELKLNGESSVCSLGLDLIDKTENL